MEFVKGHYGKKTDIFLAGAAHGRARQREEDAALCEEYAFGDSTLENVARRCSKAEDAAMYFGAKKATDAIAAAIRATGNTEEE